MAIAINIHDPDRALVHNFAHDGRHIGSVEIRCDGMSATIYTTPDKARAIADVINAVEAAPEAPPVAAE